MGAIGDEHGGRFRDLVEAFPDGILLCWNFRTVYINTAGVRLFGGSHPDEILNRPVLDLFHAGDREVVTNAIERSLRGEQGLQADATVAGLDGAARDVEIRAAVLGGPAVSVALIVRDVTERRRAELALRESEERLRHAFAGAQEGVWDWDLETGAVVYSERWKRMLGYADDEIEPHVRAWERLLHPGDRAAAEALTDAVLRDKGPYQEEFRLRHKDGHYINVLTRGLPIRRDSRGPVVRIVGTHLDITERKRTESALRESEERLTLAFAGAQEGVWDWNLDTNAVVYSPRWKQMLGYADEEIEPHVSAWERLVHPDDRAAAERANESVARGQPTYQAEFRLRHKDGHYVHVLSRGFPVRREPGGPVVRIVGTHFNLTERQKREAERVRTELLARLVFAQEDERRRIARDMHDEFGEHLTALGLRIGRLKKMCADRADLALEIDGLEATARSLDDDVERLAWELRPTALDDLGLRAALTNYVQAWSDRVGIPARLHTTGLLDERLAPDVETTLYRIAQEALNNAAKYSRARRIEVILERRTDSVLLVVEDDGVGFDTGGGTKGRGFGLVGMRERAALVGGSLEIESAHGQGTTVFVRIDVPAGAESYHRRVMTEKTSPLRILLADDHVTVRQGLKLLIDAERDMTVVGEASDGNEAVQKAHELSPDVIVMDISMPGMNGLAATRVLKKSLPDSVIVTLTRHGDNAYLQELLRAGVSAYVLKRSAPTELLHAIRAAAAGGQYLDTTLTAGVTGGLAGKGSRAKMPATALTEREAAVLRLIASGYSNKEIAAQLTLSVKTIEAHKANGMRKLDLTGRIDIVKYAILQGWLDNA